MIALLCFFLTLFASPFKSKSRFEAENAALRHQLIVLQRRVRGRVQLTNGDRLFLVQLYRWFPSVLKTITIIRPETLVRWHRTGSVNTGVGNPAPDGPALQSRNHLAYRGFDLFRRTSLGATARVGKQHGKTCRKGENSRRRLHGDDFVTPPRRRSAFPRDVEQASVRIMNSAGTRRRSISSI
jgi:hypothetical protein